jgi:alpha-L-fucosidase
MTQKIESVSMLGSGAKVTYQQQSDGLHIHVPADKPAGEAAYTYRVTLDSPAQTDPRYK